MCRGVLRRSVFNLYHLVTNAYGFMLISFRIIGFYRCKVNINGRCFDCLCCLLCGFVLFISYKEIMYSFLSLLSLIITRCGEVLILYEEV